MLKRKLIKIYRQLYITFSNRNVVIFLIILIILPLIILTPIYYIIGLFVEINNEIQELLILGVLMIAFYSFIFIHISIKKAIDKPYDV